MLLRGSPNLMRRIIEDLQLIYFDYKNEKTGKHIGALQLMPREIKTFELAFPKTAKKELKAAVEKVFAKHNKDQAGGVSLHWGPWKKDKYNPDGSEQI